jgi:predicted nucleotidyltransferase
MRFLTGATKLLTPTQETSSEMLVRRRADAVAAATRAVRELEQKSVEVLVTGSLADGSFDLHSDIDFLVINCPREMKYALEGIVEDALGDIPFDVIYLDEVAPRKLGSFTEKARRVEELD